MVITPREMRRADNHEAADVAIGRDITHFGKAAWAEEPLTLQFRVTDTESWLGSEW